MADPPGYEYGPPVTYTMAKRPDGWAEVPPRSCPSCGSPWGPNQVRVGWAGWREYFCVACQKFHKATQVDANGVPVLGRRP